MKLTFLRVSSPVLLTLFFCLFLLAFSKLDASISLFPTTLVLKRHGQASISDIQEQQWHTPNTNYHILYYKHDNLTSSIIMKYKHIAI